MFHHIPDAKAITRAANGLYRQSDLYRYKDRIFVKHGNGYAWILKSGMKKDQLDTSVESLSVVQLCLPFDETFNKLGYLVHPEFYESKAK